MELKIAFAPCKLSRIRSICKFYQTSKYVLFSSSTDAFVDNLVLEEGSKREINLLRYFDVSRRKLYPVRTADLHLKNTERDSVQSLVNYIESNAKCKTNIPNSRLNCLLVYFAKNGNINGIKAVQLIIKKYNVVHFKQQSGYKHYLAEALWVNGQIEDSLKLFSVAYDNSQIQPQVRVMLKCMFPLLVCRHSEGILRKCILIIEQFSVDKQDFIILGFLWKELFQSDWFSDHKLAKEIIEKHSHLFQVIQWMIPAIGKEFLNAHKIDDFYRLIEFTLEFECKKYEGTLIRLLFDYYYIHQNIERCSAVVKYSTDLESPLTEEQQRRYVNLLLKSKNYVSSKLNIKEPKNLNYKF